MRITFRRLALLDLPLLRGWLEQPHVARWWNHETTPAAVLRDFGPTARGETSDEDLVALVDGVPVGLVQRSAWHDHPDYVAEMEPVHPVPPGAMTLDYLVGEPSYVGRGVGTAIIAAAVADLWLARPEAVLVLVPVAAANPASWRALEKAGFSRIAEGHLEPDNPVDDGWHVIYALARPTGGSSGSPGSSV